MLELPAERWRRFAFIMGNGETNATKAARAAGFPDSESDSAKVRAHHLMHDDRVLAAIREVGSKALLGLGPLAIKRARDILDDPKHYYHGRMIETVLDRTGHFAKTEHKVTVEHTVDTSELEALARRLAAESGVPVQRLLGGTEKTIEGTAVEVKD